MFAPKKTISALVVDRFASEKGCYCAQNGPSNHADECGIVKLSLFNKINDIELIITFLLRHELLPSRSFCACDPYVVPQLPPLFLQLLRQALPLPLSPLR